MERPMTTTCASCGFSFQPTSSPARCPSCGAAAGGFAPPPMGAVPGQGAYAPGGGAYGPPGAGYGPGQPGAHGQPGVARDLDVGWLLWGAIAMVFCCQPMGIAAFIFMDQAKTAYRVGDDARAHAKMGNMKTCVYVGIGLAAAAVLLYVGIFVIAGAAVLMSKP
jgi:hypothetical protein